MVNRIICCSFDKDSIGGFITICNGVGIKREGHYSKTVAVTKEAFIAACKNRVLFNDILGVDIRQGCQNSLSAAIQCYMGMEETFDDISVTLYSALECNRFKGFEIVK